MSLRTEYLKSKMSTKAAGTFVITKMPYVEISRFRYVVPMAAINSAPMSKVIIIIVCLAVLGCVSHPLSSLVLQRDDILPIAKREIDRRHIHLPSDCSITVDEGITAFEGKVEKDREEYLVRFTFKHSGKRDVVYEVVIDKRSGKIDDFFDYRDTIRGGQ
jgi:hypothetical protein